MSIYRISCILLGILCVSHGYHYYDPLFKRARHTVHWTYPKLGDSFPSWGGLCDEGEYQSPIRLSEYHAKKSHFGSFTLNNYDTFFDNFSILNNGHGVEIQIQRNLDITLLGGPLKDKYILENIHWHWGGTEHVVDELDLILEMHLVHRNMKYKDSAKAQKQKDGLLVLSVLYRKSRNENKYLSTLFRNAEEIETPGCRAPTNIPMKIRDLLPKEVGIYFKYQGSLTTPPCSQAVTWIVFNEFLSASFNNIRKFKLAKIDDGSILEQNFRFLQPLNNREIFFNVPRCNRQFYDEY